MCQNELISVGFSNITNRFNIFYCRCWVLCWKEMKGFFNELWWGTTTSPVIRSKCYNQWSQKVFKLLRLEIKQKNKNSQLVSLSIISQWRWKRFWKKISVKRVMVAWKASSLMFKFCFLLKFLGSCRNKRSERTIQRQVNKTTNSP